MNQLQILIDMIAGLPEFALWIVAAFLVYKIAVIGSIYGVIRLAISKLHGWAIDRKKVPVDQTAKVKNIVMNDGTFDFLMSVLHKLIKSNLSYIHDDDVEWLKDAIKEKEAREAAPPPATE